MWWKKIIKWLDTNITSLILSSEWASPINIILKKVWLTVINNENMEDVSMCT